MCFLCFGLSYNVFPRLNFLLALGLLSLTTFYFLVIFVLVPTFTAFAPQWVKPLVGIAVLAAAGLTVQLLSMAMSGLRGVALYNHNERPGFTAYLSQTILLLGHVVAAYSARGLFIEGAPIAALQLLVIALLYLVGAALAVHEWRQRTAVRL